ncbi:uncharacterized protein PG998_006364 [Apiospora kogelbergensis]|uniref:uncharacterized protein n=1 Tax=Apiospora kogelbergensis TaxID=1337665 RepID=UPI0031301369
MDMSAAQNATNMHLPAIDRLPLQAISPAVLPFAPLILVIFSVAYAHLELFMQHVILPRLYGKTFTTQDKDHQSSFVMHHCALAVFIPLLGLSLMPLISILSGLKTFSDPVSDGSGVTFGDFITVSGLAYCGLYVFQMIHQRQCMSFSTLLHHVSLLLVALGTIGMTGDVAKHQSATVSFYIISVWSFFDVVTDIVIHGGLIRYRYVSQRNSNPRERSNIMHALALWRLVACMANLGATVYLLYAAWHKLSTTWAVGVSVGGWIWLFAQLQSAHVMYMISRQVWHDHRKAAAAARAAFDDDEKRLVVGAEEEGAPPRSAVLFNDPAYAVLSVGTTLFAYSHASGHVVSRSHLAIVSVGIAVGVAMFLIRYFSHDVASTTLEQAAGGIFARGENKDEVSILSPSQ